MMPISPQAVSYTHLDVYKRQELRYPSIFNKDEIDYILYDPEISYTYLSLIHILTLIEVKGIHNKSLAIDNHTLIAGSFHWLSATRHKEYSRHECSIIVSSFQADEYINNLIKELESREKMCIRDRNSTGSNKRINPTSKILGANTIYSKNKSSQ